MNSIRALFPSNRKIELINLKNIEGAIIRKKEIVIIPDTRYFPQLNDIVIQMNQNHNFT